MNTGLSHQCHKSKTTCAGLLKHVSVEPYYVMTCEMKRRIKRRSRGYKGESVQLRVESEGRRAAIDVCCDDRARPEQWTKSEGRPAAPTCGFQSLRQEAMPQTQHNTEEQQWGL